MQQATTEKNGCTRAHHRRDLGRGSACIARLTSAAPTEASRDVEARLKCYFMRDKLGEEYGGMVNGVTSFGIFVQLDSLFIEGLVHVTELGSDYFQYDEIKNELRGERTGIRYRLSDRVRVQVSRVDLDARKIDFRLVRDTPIKPHPARSVSADKSSADNGGPRVRELSSPEGGAAAPGARRQAGRAGAKRGRQGSARRREEAGRRVGQGGVRADRAQEALTPRVGARTARSRYVSDVPVARGVRLVRAWFEFDRHSIGASYCLGTLHQAVIE